MGSQFVARKCVSGWGGVRIGIGLGFVLMLGGWAGAQSGTTAPPKTPPILGTIKTIAGETMTVATDAGAETKVTVSAATKLLRVPPGSKDLSQAETIPLSEFQAGDRVLVRLRCAGDPPVCEANSVIAMKKSDIADKQTQEREAWRRGIGGLVKSVDAAQGTITISTVTAAGKKEVAVAVSKGTIVRRYAPGSVKFDDAKLSSVADIQPGDQLRARGVRGADGASFTADEIVTGSFLNISGTISAVDAGAGAITVADLATKKTEVVKVSADTQVRKLPEQMAKMISARLKGNTAEGTNASGGTANSASNGATGAPAGGTGGQQRPGGGGDFQQILNRLPAATLADFQKGDAVMIVATGGQKDGPATAITVLGGVEPLLQGTTQEQASSILTPWSLSNGGADAAAQ
jgi:hypothetical protein